MRKHSTSSIIYLVFAAIIVVFAINFGPGSGSCGQIAVNYAATVNGDPIPMNIYINNLRDRIEFYRQRAQAAGMDMSSEMIEKMGIKQQVIDELVSNKLLAYEARNWGLRVSDYTLLEYIQNRFPVVQEFKSTTEYERWVSRFFETTVARFENDIRDEILGQKIRNLLTQTVSISESEVKETYLQEHDRAMISYVKFSPKDYQPNTIAEAKIKELLSTDMAAVEAKYKEDVMAYRTPHQVAARHIFKKLPDNATDAEIAKIRGTLLDLKSQIRDGADFASLAQEHSDDKTTAKVGGNLGTFKRGTLDPALEAMAFKLKKDELSTEPLQSAKGLHLLQVTEIIPPKRKEIEEVKQEVALALLKEKEAQTVAKQKADALHVQIKKGQDLLALTLSENEAKAQTKAKKPIRYDSAWILKSQEALPRIGVSVELHQAIFALSDTDTFLDSIFEVNNSYYVVQLKDREKPDLEKYAEEKDKLKTYAITSKQSQIYRTWLDFLKQRASVQYNPSLYAPSS